MVTANETGRRAPTAADMERFRAHVEYLERFRAICPAPRTVVLVTRRKYLAVDIQDTATARWGRYLIDRTTGEVWGIRGYGQPHPGHFYGHVQDDARNRWPGVSRG